MKRRRSVHERTLPKLPEISASQPDINLSHPEPDEFVALFDDLLREFADDTRTEPTSFFLNRSSIARAYKEDRLYVISDWRLDHQEICSLFESHGAKFGPWPRWTVPAFAVMDADGTRVLDMIWVREDWRGLGYGRALVDILSVKVVCSLPGAVNFWTRLGFQPNGETRGKNMWMKRTVEF